MVLTLSNLPAFMTSPLRRRATSALLAASSLYGATFVVIKSAVAEFPPLAFVAWRFLLGAAVLAVLAMPRGVALWRHGAITGGFLFLGYALQTTGLTFTSASNSALITGLYVVFTPFVAAIVRRHAPSPWSIVAAVVSFAGLVLLTGTAGLRLQVGDLLTLGCALAFAGHIVTLARYAKHHPVVAFTAVQLAVTSVLAFAAALLVEDGLAVPSSSDWVPIALTGFGVSVGAYLLQVWAQTVMDAATTAVVLAAEPAFGVATAWIVLSETLTASGWIGAALIVGAIYLAITREEDEPALEAEAVTAAH